MLVGSAIGGRRLLVRWIEGRRLAGAFLWWFGWCYGAGLFAVAPTFLRRLGFPEGFCDGWWMNLFLFHPLIDHWLPKGRVVGGGLIILMAAAQYALLILAIHRAKKQQTADLADPR